MESDTLEGGPSELGEDAAKGKLVLKPVRGMGISAHALEFLEHDLDALRLLMGSSVTTSVQDKIGFDKGVDPEATGELTVWEGLEFIQGT